MIRCASLTNDNNGGSENPLSSSNFHMHVSLVWLRNKEQNVAVSKRARKPPVTL